MRIFAICCLNDESFLKSFEMLIYEWAFVAKRKETANGCALVIVFDEIVIVAAGYSVSVPPIADDLCVHSSEFTNE